MPINIHKVQTRCTDDSGLSYVAASFRNSTHRRVTGTEATVTFSSIELGEGMGTLSVRCCDVGTICVERLVRNYLVDLTPPDIDTDRIAASPTGEGFDGEIGIWARDGWVLGSVELKFRGKSLKRELPHAYPSTLGESWDVTRIGFAAKDLPLGSGTAVVVATDAAGNVAEKEIQIRIDGKAPTVSILEPTVGAVVAAGQPIKIRVSAHDEDNPTAPTTDLFVGGSFIAELPGEASEIEIDASSLPPGPTEIRAVARDDAGNRSSSAAIMVNLEE